MARIPLPDGPLDEAYRAYSYASHISSVAARYSEVACNEVTFPVRLRELVRVRIGEINQCKPCMGGRVPDLEADGLSEDLMTHTAEWATYPGYSDAERAALEFTTLWATDHLNITDELVNRMLGFFGPETLMEIYWAIGAYLVNGRVSPVFDLSVSCQLVMKPGASAPVAAAV